MLLLVAASLGNIYYDQRLLFTMCIKIIGYIIHRLTRVQLFLVSFDLSISFFTNQSYYLRASIEAKTSDSIAF